MSAMEERGQFYVGHSGAVAAVQSEAEMNDWTPAQVIDALHKRDLMPRPSYYVPSLKEWYRALSDLRRVSRAGTLPVRWVMCREILDELARRYARQLVPDAISFTFVRADDEALLEPPAALHLVDRPKGKPAMLFGVPIRVDPAARTPLFEIWPDGG